MKTIKIKNRRTTVCLTEREWQLAKEYKKKYGRLFNMSELLRVAIRDAINQIESEVKDFEEWKKTKPKLPLIAKNSE